jgi:hypothetical protein
MPGLNEYRAEDNKGYTVLGVSGSFDITEKMTIGIIVKKLLNNKFMARPGPIKAPSNITLRYYGII